MDRSTVRTLMLVGVVVGAAGIAAAAFSGGTPVQNGVPVGPGNGLVVTVEGDTQLKLDSFTQSSDTVEIVTADGNVTVSSSGAADVTIDKDNITGTYTNASGILAGFATITMDPEDKQQVTVGKDIETVAWKSEADVALDDGTPDFTYSGPSGVSRVTIGGVRADTQIGAVDPSGPTLLDVATSNGNGRVTFDELDNSDHTVELQTSDGPPEVTNADPTGGLSTPPNEVSVDVDDPDFTADNVTVEISIDGSVVKTTDISSAQTVTASVPASAKTGGTHTWTVNATDSYGQTTLEEYEYKVPATLYIRNETNYSQLIDTPTTTEVRFFTDDTVITRTSSDGKVNLTGLPVGENFIVTLEPDTANLTDRTVYLTNIYSQQSVYLLNTTAYPEINARFTLNDPTGEFGSESVLYIEKPINKSGTVEYDAVHADKFGAEGVTATLEEGQRYRLRIRAPDGDTQVIGPYRGEVSETVTVQPGTPTIAIGNLSDGYGTSAELRNQTLEYRYADPDNETDELTVVIYRRGHPDDLLVPNESYFDLGNVSRTLTLNSSEKAQTWVVRFEVDRDGEQFVIEKPVSNRPDVLPDLSAEWRLISGILLLLLSAGAFSLVNSTVGAIVVASEGALLWWIGWLAGATTGVLVVMALFVAVMVSIYDSGGP